MAICMSAASARIAMSDCRCSFSLNSSTSSARLPVTVSVVSWSRGAQREYDDTEGALAATAEWVLLRIAEVPREE